MGNIKPDGIRMGGTFHIVDYKNDGSKRWEVDAKNMVVNVGLQHILDVVFSGSTQSATWYIGLTGTAPTVASTNTMVTHAGWTEFENYDEATRQEWVEVRTNQSMTNSASKATFTISADSSTIGGAFITSSNTRGGSAGTLMCAAAFTGGDKSADDGDTLEVQYTYTAGDDGA
jgi:hypothetical protein